ncbi:YEATS domain-containing protein 2 [Gouania willdenowi]|uniref:YEATS domain-containing protein 2 n=1 Tax=Gouania willdenowi TaxID=441366 RepID=A0A8C5GIQ0_GOUWI|nr:YEATS domain-containing protein 2 [Gouania willdenowi]
MSGIKRKIEDNDPDYEDISQVHDSKRNKAAEHNAREATVHKIEAIIREQFSLEMKNKEHEIDVISQRLNEARRMMDKLRACIVANYYANAGMTKLPEPASKSDPAVLNHPAIRRFLESPSRSSSPLNQGSETLSQVPSESESLSQQGDGERAWTENSRPERRPGRNTGRDTFGVPSTGAEQRVTYHTTGDETSRLYAKKTIVVGNVSKYIPPDKREENDQSTHKWMVYVRGSRREPSIDHFVKKVWFFLHPSYKPNDLVEVSEPPFHLTRRGWGEFPVRIQIHFKDTRNKRIDIIHQLKLDRTYTGLQTLGAETVVDVELHRDTLGEDYVLLPPSSKETHRAASPTSASSIALSHDHPSSPVSHNSTADKSVVQAEVERPAGSHSSNFAAGERTPTRPKAGDRVTLSSHGHSAFQPLTASCKIIPQGQPPSPAESPGKSFQPITMSCKIVSGSPISTPSHSPLPRTPTNANPSHSKQSSSSVHNNPYIIVDKPGPVIGMASSSSSHSTGSPSAKLSAAQGARSPAPKVHTGTLLSSGMKVIIKQEPGEVSTQQQQVVATVTGQQQSAATAAHQLVAVKGSHMISMSAQKQAGGATGATTSKVLGLPVSSALQSSVKQVAISSGQILVAKGNPSVSKVMGGKQVLAQGVAKAIVSAAGSISGQQAGTKAAGGSSGKSGVMATLQLPANNLANLANLPPGTKLYLTTNSKNPSGKGKLLLIPQGAILRASSASQQSQSSSSASTGNCQNSSSSSSSGSLPSNLSYTSYILKQTPQGTFLVGQSAQGSGKHGGSGSAGHSGSSTAGFTQQAIRVTAGQKAAILAQVVGSSQGAQVRLSDGSVKTVTAAGAGHLSKPGTTTLRMTGGVITAASSSSSSSGSVNSAASQQQATDAGKLAAHQSLLVAANQAAVISAAKSASAAAAGSVSKTTVASLVKGAASLTKGAGVAAAGAKGVASINVSKGNASKSSSTSVNAASVVNTVVGGGKACAALSGVLKIHSGGSSSQQTVVTIPANQLKQLGVGSGGLQSLLMPVGKVKTEPGAFTAGPSPPVTVPAPTSVQMASATSVKQEQGADTSAHDLINTEHIETMMQLLTAVVKKFPLIVPDKTEDSHPFCASSTEHYYSWNIGKRRASELQRAVAVKRVVQDVLDRSPRLQALTPPKTREVVQWCRQRGYTPPDPDPAHKNDDESMEDILTQIDNEPECPSTLSSCEELMLRLEQMQALLKTEPEDADDEIVDIITVSPPCQKLKVKEEEQEADVEPKFFLAPCVSAEFVSETAQQIGVSFQPVEVEKNVFAPVVEAMILKATEQFASDILREALAGAYAKSPPNRVPREITAMNVHQAVSSIPTSDFLTNSYMAQLDRDD